MKKFLALILALCMCIAVLVACKDTETTDTDTETKAETTAETEAETKKPSSNDDDDEDEDDEGGEEDEGDENVPDAKIIEIGSVAEWEALATAGDPDKADFNNTTVKLTANIDFGTAKATTLFKTFMGTFDGDGHTVKGKTVSRMSLIANELVGATVKNVTVEGFGIVPPEGLNAEYVGIISQKITSGDADTTAEDFEPALTTISNVTLKNVNHDGVTSAHMASTARAGFIAAIVDNGALAVSDYTVDGGSIVCDAQGFSNGSAAGIGQVATTGNLSFERINLKGIAIKNNASPKGSLIGVITKAGESITVDKCNVEAVVVDNTSTAGSHALGGLIGFFKNTEKGSALTVNKASLDVVVMSAGTYSAVGGIIGRWGKDGKNCIGGSVTVNNCYVTGNISAYKGGFLGKDGTMCQVAPICGEFGSKEGSYTVTNTIMAVGVNQVDWRAFNGYLPEADADLTMSYMIEPRVITGYVSGRHITGTDGEGNETYEIISPNFTGCWTTITTRITGGSGTAEDPWKTEAYSKDGVGVISQSDINSKITKNGGYIESVTAYVPSAS